MSGIALGLHGGCGTLERGLQSEADWAESRAHLAQALRAGGSALDAVQATVVESSYFTTQRRVDALRLLQQRAQIGTIMPATEAEKHGTVGAVARDAPGPPCRGHLHGWFQQQTRRPDRRQPDHRHRYLCA